MKAKSFTGAWHWKNFTPQEIACKHCGELWEGDHPMPEYFKKGMDTLQALRDLWGKPITLTSAHRCKQHNANIGGSPRSQHMQIAFDCVVMRGEQETFKKAAIAAGFTAIGLYPNRNFVHVDARAGKADGSLYQWQG